MIIHHGKRSKMIIERFKGARVSLEGNLFIAYEMPESKNRGIVEFSAEEVAKIALVLSKRDNVTSFDLLKKLRGGV